MLTPYLMAKNMFDELAESAFTANTLRGMMNTDIKESDEGYELDIDLPGVHKENLAAELKDGYLCISATMEQTHNDNGRHPASVYPQSEPGGSGGAEELDCH